MIIDYKTGQPPSKKEIEKRWAAQLPLEAAIAMAGGFKDIPPQPIAGIEVIKLNGGHKPGERIEIDIDAEEMARSHLENFKALIAQYDHPAVPYLSRPRVQFISRVGDYDHLARVREWSAAGTEGAEP